MLFSKGQKPSIQTDKEFMGTPRVAGTSNVSRAYLVPVESWRVWAYVCIYNLRMSTAKRVVREPGKHRKTYEERRGCAIVCSYMEHGVKEGM